MRYRIKTRGVEGAIGGYYEEVGKMQFEFLREKGGLGSSSLLLDVGCGSLRGGRYFIRYLNEHNYVGIDISPEIVEAAKEIVQCDKALADKRPRIYLVEGFNWELIEVLKFDIIFAQAVLTQMPLQDIKQLLAQAKRFLCENGVIYFTYFESKERSWVRNYQDFYYTLKQIRKTAEECGLRIARIGEEEYPHPHGQIMLKGTVIR